MRLLDGVAMAFSALRKHPMRTFLTALGIIIGIGAVVSVVAIGDGARVLTLQEIQATGGTNILEIYRNEWQRSGRGGTLVQTARQVARGRWRYNRGEDLRYDDAIAIEQFAPAIVSAIPELQDGSVFAMFEGNSKDARLVGTLPDYQRSYNWYVMEGRFLNDRDVEYGARVAVIGSQLAKDLFGDLSPIGHWLRVQRVRQRWGDSYDLRLKVIGVMEPKGDIGATEGWDDTVIIPVTTYQQRVTGSKRVERIRAEVVDVSLLDQAVQQVEAVLKRQHPGPENAYEIWMAMEELQVAERTGLIMKLMLGGIASIALAVAGIGIMNIMLISVTERTREIGVRKALGARRRDILFQFLIESATLSLGGGVLGIAFGYFLGNITADLISRLIWEGTQWPVAFSPLSIIVAFTVAVIVGITFGMYPANRAARLNPTEALRYE